MRTSIVIAPLLAALATAQTILTYGSGALPTCAETCTELNNAQTVCIPSGGAPVSNQATYDSCFCQSGYLTGLSTSAATICATTCTSQSDRTQIQSWFNSFCNSASASATAAAATTTTAAAAATGTASTATTASTASTTAASSSSTSTGSAADSADADVSGSSAWWHVHGRWIAMAIVLLAGFIIIFIVGCLYKRHRQRKQHRASMAAPVVWGPHQNQHHSGGVNYGGQSGAGMNSEKGKQKAPILPTSNQAPMDYSEKDGRSKGTGRLKKFIGR